MADDPKPPSAIDLVQAFPENAKDITEPRTPPEKAAPELHPSIAALKSPTLVEQARSSAPDRAGTGGKSAPLFQKPTERDFVMPGPLGDTVRKNIKTEQRGIDLTSKLPPRVTDRLSGEKQPSMVVSKENVREGTRGILDAEFTKAKDRGM